MYNDEEWIGQLQIKAYELALWLMEEDNKGHAEYQMNCDIYCAFVNKIEELMETVNEQT